MKFTKQETAGKKTGGSKIENKKNKEIFIFPVSLLLFPFLLLQIAIVVVYLPKNQRKMTKITIEITDPKGLKLLEDLEDLNILRIIKNEEKKPFDAKQFRGILSKDEADGFRKHIQKIRNEWEQNI